MSNNIDQILTLMEKLTLLEASELSTKMKEKFNIPDMVVAAPASAPAAKGQEEQSSAQKSSFDAKFVAFSDPSAKIKGIKAIAEELGISLADAKKKSEEPFVVKSGCTKDEAESIKKRLGESGCNISLE